ncbi:similar to hypothetical protein KAFR_0G02990 [Kazachstania africana CBS 2517] [Maudiozyma barnettii]|uniref:Uncharacterized protein n=1 Tax=Maudiozyma barnettii TaxID=61262 RepID=A0A8H2VEC8_9SACH|nr:similar to hypothetical protein KAFR_0G02990 [Kazachstania africana CBS 2517] [Kazachstania barnettii]CAB4254044.1 similar to hypothetical protein KAFR_0G02990 [Kazachstania africana CBS 2517] [Kazachstania barnettii]CAD1781794.1 similar to hypothetical protein KAFR_0G02990 [Kazachstania africana CBS 2517] [Kazachstania barnettii]
MPHNKLPTFPIPDVRFSNVFYTALAKETKRQKLNDPNFKIITKVLLRDVILMPFIQSIVWTGFIISFKPTLKQLVQSTKSFNTFIYSLITGNDLHKQ